MELLGEKTHHYGKEPQPVIALIMNLTSPDAGYHVAVDNRSCLANETLDYEGFYRRAQYVTGLIIYPILCIIGITGNVLALIVLSHRDMATSTNVYLSALAVSDTIKLFNDLLYFVMVVLFLNDAELSEKMKITLYPFAHYIFNMAVCITAWLTVSVALERYISVCHPSRAKQLCTISRARLVCAIVFIIMILLSLPSLFRYKVETFHDDKNNITCSAIIPTDLGNNEAFMVPYTWIQNALRAIIPLFVLIYLNARIINELRKERVKGKRLSSRNRITLMLIIIILVFVICITPDAVMSTFFGKGYVEEGNLVKGIREITDSLLAVNSAFNFVLYCALSIVFRNTFLRIFCACRPDLVPKDTRRSMRNGSTHVIRNNSKDVEDKTQTNAQETYV
ncbi:FMRFamide receptor-like [Haliotis rubra]|uniref:FMRFamide receptor-like n=1 Tax=Haliotis rubra TaxID=36100 RepID=UPI001EE5F7AE|nr:FMRFamide receptor-like [Haliotis rubra]XP_046549732.1 FMRFamide receptor-like [Haliotis rubra]XP_046549733.1 FMRFamide receptor-like [Haliotis rubra]XP_046549734.1 FMRFamide receptor-like [Haliotis rubra]XP_046549735.1 FMRFamide receptor-like [Haliotis rubra]XP_046549736.1 FMRFamide receptor-like [Haliotis rubra]